MTLEYSNSLCEICGSSSNGKHFGVESCRACAAFFRRSLAQNPTYFCRRSTGKCEGSKITICKFCRLQRCRDVGMKREKKSDENCVICGRKSNGINFGVRCCWGCAAFYRASTDRESVYTCTNPDNLGPCEKSKLLVCKYCRFEKCKHSGMNREPKTDVKIVEERISYSVWHPRFKAPVRWIDVNPILRRSMNILENFHPPTTESFVTLNPLQKLNYSLSRLRSAQSKNPKIESSMLFDDYFSHWEEHMTRAAEWLMHSKEFRELPVHERQEFFKTVWAIWRRVERNFMCAEVFGQRGFDEKIMMISDDSATKLDEFFLDVSEISGNGFNEYRRTMRQVLCQYIPSVLKPCSDWKFSDMEQNFALCQIVWIYAGRKLLGQTQVAGEKFLEKVSDNLHEYYKNSLKVQNYAARLAVLMEVVNAVLKLQQEHEKVMEMAFLFDMFSVVVSEPKLFQV